MHARLKTLTGPPAALGLTALLAMAGCGSDDNDKVDSKSSNPAPTTTAAPSAGTALKLSADPNGKLAFTKTELTAKAGKVTLVMTNPASSGVPHAVAVEGNGVDKDGPTAAPGRFSAVSASLKAGTYKFYCPVDGHEKAGMEGSLTVN